eukprot:COSAG06_NODE_11924_length_1447_cov_1.089763_3_plen_219_part_01
MALMARLNTGRQLRALELSAYLTAALLSDAAVWQEEVVQATLGLDSGSATEIVAMIWGQQQPELPPAVHPELPSVDAPVTAETSAASTEQWAQECESGPLPVHLCGRYTHDERSDDWEPVLEAMGLPWIVRKVGRYMNPDVELYFTKTHFNVWGKTALGPNTDSFPLSGKEERLADMSEGSPVEEPMSYMCRTGAGGRTIKTWSWIWHADGKSKKWLTT